MTIKGKEIKKSWIAAACVVAATVIVIILSMTVLKSDGVQKNSGKKGRGNTVVSVRTMEAAATTLHGYVSTNGEVESQSSVNVFPDVSGKVMETAVMLGSVVKRGDIIGYVDPNSPGSYYKRSPVYAPISGSVISTPLKNGTTVTTGTTICIIGDINNLQVTASVPERFVAVLKTGLKADVSVEAYPGVVFPATVSRVSPVVDAASRTKEVILNFDTKDSRVNAGMFAKVVLYTEDYKGFPVMPADAVVSLNEENFAFVIGNENKVQRRKIKTGNSVDGMIQVLEGINEGERIVIQGQTALSDGSTVRDISLSAEKKVDESDKAGKQEKK